MKYANQKTNDLLRLQKYTTRTHNNFLLYVFVVSSVVSFKFLSPLKNTSSPGCSLFLTLSLTHTYTQTHTHTHTHTTPKGRRSPRRTTSTCVCVRVCACVCVRVCVWMNKAVFVQLKHRVPRPHSYEKVGVRFQTHVQERVCLSLRERERIVCVRKIA